MKRRFEDTPLLIGLGAARTGTRWLSGYFADHPDILMSRIRVLHYFDARYQPEQYARFNDKFEARLRRLVDRRNGTEPDGQSRPKDFDTLQNRVRMMEDERAYVDYFRKR